MIVGGIYQGDVHFRNFEASIPYKQDDMTWCVSHAKPIPRWQNLLYIANLSTVAIVVVLIMIVVWVVYLLHAFEDVPPDWFFCAFLSLQTITTFPTMFRSKRFRTKMLFGLMLLIAYWTTQLFSVHIILILGVVRYEIQIDTVDGIIEENFHLAGNPSVIDRFKMEHTMVKLIEISNIVFNY